MAPNKTELSSFNMYSNRNASTCRCQWAPCPTGHRRFDRRILFEYPTAGSKSKQLAFQCSPYPKVLLIQISSRSDQGVPLPPHLPFFATPPPFFTTTIMIHSPKKSRGMLKPQVVKLPKYEKKKPAKNREMSNAEKGMIIALFVIFGFISTLSSLAGALGEMAERLCPAQKPSLV